MEQSQLLAHWGSSKITREKLKVIQTPPGSPTHQPVPHYEIVGALAETLSFRQISVVREEYAVSGDGMKMFGANPCALRSPWATACWCATTWRFTEISRPCSPSTLST